MPEQAGIRFGFHSKLHGKPLWILSKGEVYVKGGSDCAQNGLGRRKDRRREGQEEAGSNPAGIRCAKCSGGDWEGQALQSLEKAMTVKDVKNITSHPFLSGGGAFDQLPSDTGEKRSPEGENGKN